MERLRALVLLGTPLLLLPLASCVSEEPILNNPLRDGGPPDEEGGPTPNDHVDGSPEEDATIVNPEDPPVLLVTGDLDFGQWTCGDPLPDARTLTVTNTGSRVAGYTTFIHAGQPEQWEVENGSGVLAAGASATVTVRPRPITFTNQTFAGHITILPVGDALGGLSVPVGLTVAGARVRFGSLTADFGDVALGTPRGAKGTVYNDGTAPATVTVHATSSPDFAPITIGTQTLAPGDSIEVVSTFTPTQPGSSEQTITISATGPICSIIASPMVVRGRGSSGSIALGGDVNFGPVECGSIPTTRSLEIRNTGTTNATYTASLGRGASSPFSLVAGASGTLTPGVTSQIQISAAPIPYPLTDLSDIEDVLTVSSGVPGEPPKTVRVRVTPEGAILRHEQQGSLQVLEAAEGQTVTSSEMTIRNDGNKATTFTLSTSFPQVFALENAGPVTLEPGQRLTFRVRATPTGPRYQSIVGFASDPPSLCAPVVNPPRVQTQVPAGIAVGADVVDFGDVPCTDTSQRAQLVPIRNNSAVESRVFQVSLSDATHYGLRYEGAALGDGTSGSFSLDPGKIGLLEVVAKPQAAGSLPEHLDAMLVLRSGAFVRELPIRRTLSGAVVAWAEPSLHVGEIASNADVELDALLVNYGSAPASVKVTSGGGVRRLKIPHAIGLDSRRPVPGVARVPLVVRAPAGSFDQTVSVELDEGSSLQTLCAPLPAPAHVQGTASSKTIEILTPHIDLGDVALGKPATSARSVRIRNRGTTPVTLGRSLAQGWFELGGNSTVELPPDSEAEIPIFAVVPEKAAPGPIHDVLKVTASSGASFSIPVVEVVRGLVVEVPEGPIVLPPTAVGEVSQAVPVGLRMFGNVEADVVLNVGAGSEEIVSIARGGGRGTGGSPTSHRAPFVRLQRDTTSALTTTLTVHAPAGSPVVVSGSPAISISAPASTSNVVVTPTTIDFGPTACGAGSHPKTVRITNPTSAPVNFAIAPDAGLTSLYEVSPASGTLAPGQTRNITFTPSSIPANLTSTGIRPTLGAYATFRVSSGSSSHLVSLAQAVQGAYYELELEPNVKPDGSGVMTMRFAPSVSLTCALDGCTSNLDFWYTIARPGGCSDPGHTPFAKGSSFWAVRDLVVSGSGSPIEIPTTEIIGQCASGAAGSFLVNVQRSDLSGPVCTPAASRSVSFP